MPNDMSQQPELVAPQVTVPAQSVIIAPASRLLAGVRDLVIDSDAVYEAAASDLAAAKSMKKAIDADRKELTKPLDEAKSRIMDKYRPAIDVCEQVITTIEPKMLTYRAEQQAKADAERRRLDAEARAERERLQREADDARRVAAEEAEKLAAAGKTAEAEETIAATEAEALTLQQTAEVVSAAPTSVAPPKVSGTAVAGTYKGRVLDKLKFIAFVAANPMFADLLDVNESGLNAQARSLKTNLKMDGIEVYLEQSIRSRAH